MKRLLALIPISIIIFSMVPGITDDLLKRGVSLDYFSDGPDLIIIIIVAIIIITMCGLYVVHTENKQDFVPENSNMVNNFFIKNRFISFRIGMVGVIINVVTLALMFTAQTKYVGDLSFQLLSAFEKANSPAITEVPLLIWYLAFVTVLAIACLSIANKVSIANYVLVFAGILSLPFLTGPLLIISGIAGTYQLKEAPNETKNTLEIDKLKAQIERLDLLLKEGILTEEEYQTKRNNLINQ